MAKPAALPPHILQLVDKKNYVIAIKTHASEQSISMEEAKNQIDAYEMQSDAKNLEKRFLKNLESRSFSMTNDFPPVKPG